jgi:hypothetical protein
MPSSQQGLPLVLTEPEASVILRIRQVRYGSVVIKVQDGVPVFLQKIVEDIRLV